MRNLWTQAVANGMRLTLLWRSGHVLAPLFYFCAAQQMTETPDANMPGIWEHIIAFSSSFRPNRRVRFHLPSVPVRPKDFADRTGKARTHEYASEPESSRLSSPFRPGENGKQNRRQGKTQLLTTVSRAASPEAASPFFGVT